MRNILIGGTVRAGKTTLANMMRERFVCTDIELVINEML